MKHTVTWNDRASFSRLHIKYTLAFFALIIVAIVSSADISASISFSQNVEEEILLGLKRAVNMRRARREMFELVHCLILLSLFRERSFVCSSSCLAR